MICASQFHYRLKYLLSRDSMLKSMKSSNVGPTSFLYLIILLILQMASHPSSPYVLSINAVIISRILSILDTITSLFISPFERSWHVRSDHLNAKLSPLHTLFLLTQFTFRYICACKVFQGHFIKLDSILKFSIGFIYKINVISHAVFVGGFRWILIFSC